MDRQTFAKVPNLGRPAARCRKSAERCRARADKSYNWQEEDSWLELASEWVRLAEVFENEDRLALN
jgi:hypothetical protein